MISIIVIAVGVLIAVVLILAASKPGIFRIQRATDIKAPPEKVFALINDFKAWSAWWAGTSKPGLPTSGPLRKISSELERSMKYPHVV